MAFMFTDLGGVIRIGKYTPEGAIPLGKGKEDALVKARAALCEPGCTAFVIPGFSAVDRSAQTTLVRQVVIADFREQVEAFLKGGAK